MTAAWITVIAVGAATAVFKSLGPLLLGGREIPASAAGTLRFLAPALLAALVLVQLVGGDREILLDERLVGFGAATIALVLRAPLVVVVLVAAATTAATRAWLS